MLAWSAFLRPWPGKLIVLSLLALISNPAAAGMPAPGWPSFGYDLAGTRYNAGETRLSSQTVSQLKLNWVYKGGNDFSAQPAVANGVVYAASWDGQLYAIRAATGELLWAFDVKNFHAPGVDGAIIRDTPAVDGRWLYVGDMHANLYRVQTATGQVDWAVHLGRHPAAVITGSPVLAEGRVYVGLSSNEEHVALQPDYPCCSFHGSLIAVDAGTGQIVWHYETLPDAYQFGQREYQGKTIPKMGPSGSAIWSAPAIDLKRRLLYLTTGNDYSVPDQDYTDLTGTGPKRLSDGETGPEAKTSEAIIALNLDDGSLKWKKQLDAEDGPWTEDCLKGKSTGANCPAGQGGDFDFGAGPMLFTVHDAQGQPVPAVGAGQKSGWFHTLNAETGQVIWQTQVGPGGSLGGILWGTATDGQRIYAPISNAPNAGLLAALDVNTGKVLWKRDDPGGRADAAPAIAAGPRGKTVVFEGSMDGSVRAYDGASGRVLWSAPTGASIYGGATVAGGALYVGSGYRNFGLGQPNDKLYAFSLDGAQNA
ncbi:MAG TPA: PQQ-binding-like beta-propeller repeat protein [Chloroflexota bacterium]|nr:PQQ-binding-like beta-propeller repeat protein [Chloroflexota bacterium]